MAEANFKQVAQELQKGMTATAVNKRQRAAVEYFASKNNAKFTDTGRANISLMTKGQREASKLELGQMFTYSYHAKHAETLPFWDRYPLMVFLDINKHGNLLGLNLHYLDPRVRAKILGKLMEPIEAKTLRHDTKLRITYNMVKNIKDYKPLGFAIKSYIPQNIGSKIVRIQPSDWTHAVFLPSQLFVGASDREVWARMQQFVKGK